MFEVIALKECPFSARAVELLENLSHQNPNIKVKITWVDQSTKQKYKTSERSTFPQIFYHVKTSKGLKKLFIGGCDNLEQLITIKESLKQQYGSQIIVPLLQLMTV